MPIRFRCAYCNQLMGIARRKAGTVVSCPKCAGQVVVPTPPPGEDDGPDNPRGGNEGLFEQSDFEKILNEDPAAVPQVAYHQTVPNAFDGLAQPKAAHPNVPEYEAVRLGPAQRPARGIFLTPGVLIVVSALVVVLMGLSFFLGLLLGRS